MIDMKNETEQSSCHSRDCEAITDNLSRIITSVIPDLIGYLSQIKKEAAEIFGSCVASPKITIKRHSEAEPNNPRKVQHNDWILHFAFAPFRMTIPAQALALVLTFGIISESLADVISCINGKHADGTACEKCGDNCNWSFDTTSGKLSISGSGNMTTRKYQKVNDIWGYQTDDGKEVPWKEYMKQITYVDIKGVSSIGSYSFLGANIRDFSIDNTVREIEGCAFCNNQLTYIEIPDSVTKLDWGIFNGNNLSHIVIPDTLESLREDDFGRDLEILENLKIICKGNTTSCVELKNKLSNYLYYDNQTSKFINFPLKEVSYASEQQCTGNIYFWNGAECVRQPDVSKRKCCADVCKDMGGWCNRVRYTPAEAAAILKNEGNSVILTFKK